MMQANELRVGNVLDIDGNYWQVSDILTDKGVLSELYFKENQEYNHLRNAKPIPFSKDVLKSCSFELDAIYINGLELKLVDDRLEGGFVDNEYGIDDESRITLNYLHELQNLCYSLNKRELKINL